MDMMVGVFFFFLKGMIQVFWNEWFKTYLETPLSPLDASMFFFCLTSVVCGYIAACPCFRWIKLDPAITRKGRPAQTSGSYSPLFPNTASEYSVHVIQVWRWTRSHAVRSSSSIGSDPKAAVQQQSVKAIDFRYLRIYKASSQLLFGGSPSFSTFYSHPFFCGFILFFLGHILQSMSQLFPPLACDLPGLKPLGPLLQGCQLTLCTWCELNWFFLSMLQRMYALYNTQTHRNQNISCGEVDAVPSYN